MIKTILREIITQCSGKQDIIKKLASCDPYSRKSGLKTVAFLLRLSIQSTRNTEFLVIFIYTVFKYNSHEKIFGVQSIQFLFCKFIFSSNFSPFIGIFDSTDLMCESPFVSSYF